MFDQTPGTGRTMTDEELEKKLKPYTTVINAASIFTLIGFAAIIIGVIGLLIFKNSGRSVVCWVLILGGFAAVFCSLFLSAKKKSQYDAIMMQELGPQLEEIISSYIGPDLKQGDDAVITARLRQSIADTGLVPRFDDFYPDSYRKGSWKGQVFEGFNARLTETVEVWDKDDDGTPRTNTEVHTRFDGTWILAALKREFPSPVVIREVKGRKDRKDLYWNVTTENPAFNEKYCVHADDPRLAYELLTPRFTEQLLSLDVYTGAECGFCFAGRTLYMAIYGGQKFLSMEGQSTGHVKNLLENLRASMEHTCGLLDRLMVSELLFGP